MKSPVRVFVAFIAGLVVGSIVGVGPALAFIEPVGTLWINAIRMPIIPLIVALIVAGVASTQDTRAVGAITGRALLTFLVLLSVTAAVATLVAPMLLSGMSLDPSSIAALRASASTTAATPPPLSVADWLVNLVPVNPVRAAADGALLPLVVFSLLYGLALTRVSDERRRLQVTFFQGVADALIGIIGWVLVLAPFGIFALAYTLGARVGIPAAGAVGWYMLVTCIAVIASIIVLYVLMVTVGRVPLRPLIAALLPAQVIALSTRSSLASLPALIDGVQTKLHLPERVTAVVLPLAASVFKINAAVTWSFGAVFVARLYGVDLGSGDLAIFAVATVLLSLATPGIPSGGFFVQAPLYAAIGLPVEGLGVLIAVDLVIDMVKTAANITGFAAASVLVARVTPSATPAPR